jgi:hypothetical protein
MTDEDEIVSRSLFRCDAMTLAVLPNVALVASHGMRTVIEVISMHTASGAVEIPFVIVFLVLLEISLKLFFLRPDLSFRLALGAFYAVVFALL